MSTERVSDGLGGRLAHGLQRMTGRNRGEHGRASTPLELLYDLTVVVAIALAGGQLAHALTTGHVGAGIAAFCFVMFAIVWAWISYSWFASAFDTDDWFMRLATLVQMIGVLIIGLGVADIFVGIEEDRLENTLVVVGYVVMRLALVALWVRVAKESPEHAAAAKAYIKVIIVAQIGWVAVAFLHLSLAATVPFFAVLYVVELGGAYAIETRVKGPTGTIGTPWHPHHIAERYSLLVIITLGEVILGTTTAIDAITTDQGWSLQAVLVALAGVGLAVGIWWIYFALPLGDVLARRPEAGFRFGWGHLPLFAAIAATGAGLHVAASFVEEATTLDETGTILALAVPVAVAIAMMYLITHLILPMHDRFHLLLVSLTVAVLGVAVLMSTVGVPIGWCLFVITMAPWVSVIGYETLGHRHLTATLDALGSAPPAEGRTASDVRRIF